MNDFWAYVGVAVASFVLGAMFCIDGITKAHQNDCLRMGKFRAGDYVFECKIQEPHQP